MLQCWFSMATSLRSVIKHIAHLMATTFSSQCHSELASFYQVHIKNLKTNGREHHPQPFRGEKSNLIFQKPLPDFGFFFGFVWAVWVFQGGSILFLFACWLALLISSSTGCLGLPAGSFWVGCTYVLNRNTVDGSEIRRENHLRCIKPCK